MDENMKSPIQESYEKCQKWVIPPAKEIDDKISEAVRGETESKCVFCEEGARTQKMTAVCTTAAHDALSSFHFVYSEFMASCNPYIDRIKKIYQLENDLHDVDRNVDELIKDENKLLESANGYKEACEEQCEANKLYRGIRLKEGNRDVIMRPAWLYVVLLVIVAVGEVMINYSFMLQFMDIPAFAFASAAAIGGVVAWASHEHGRALKQFSFYYGSHVRPEDKKHVSWTFVVASIFLIIVFIAIYYVRYIAVVNAEANMMLKVGVDILDSGSEASLGLGPHASALTSLGSNAAVWGLSIWIATIFHDPNPHYMHAAKQKQRADAKVNRISKTRNANIKALNASREVRKQTFMNEIKSLSEELGEYLDFYNSVEEKRSNITKQLANDVNKYLMLYRNYLVRFLTHSNEVVVYSESNDIIDAREYGKMNVKINEVFVSELIHW